MQAELKCYAKARVVNVNRAAHHRYTYEPGLLTKDQLLKATKEWQRRNENEAEDDDNDEGARPWVLVSPNCDDMPTREFEIDALKATAPAQIDKLWYVLTASKDLLIKYQGRLG